MKSYYVWSLGLSAILGGVIGRSCGLEQQVKTICSHYAEQRHFNFTLEVEGAPVNIPELFSRYEHFIPQEIKKEVLTGKVGFKYEVDLRHPALEGKEGTVFEYEIVKEYGEPAEQLMITEYDSSDFFYQQMIRIITVHGKMFSLNIMDRRNNVTVSLYHNQQQDISFDPAQIDETAAKKLWDLYSTMFFEFKQKQNLDSKVARYIPQLDVRHSLP